MPEADLIESENLQNLARVSQSLMGIPDVSGSLTVNLTKQSRKRTKSWI